MGYSPFNERPAPFATERPASSAPCSPPCGRISKDILISPGLLHAVDSAWPQCLQMSSLYAISQKKEKKTEVRAPKKAGLISVMVSFGCRILYRVFIAYL